jgi:hypothetical protein
MSDEEKPQALRKPIPDKYLADLPPGAIEFVERGARDDCRWGFSISRVDQGPRTGLWVIGWRLNAGFPMFPVEPGWRFEDYDKAFHEFLDSDNWGRMAWVVNHCEIRPEYEVAWQ